MSLLNKILGLAGKQESAVYGLVKVLRDQKSWVTRLLLVESIIIVLFNPVVVTKVLVLFTDWSLPPWYKWVFWFIVVLIVGVVFVEAWRTAPGDAGGTDFSERSAIKGLRPFEPGDAALFKRLQREESLRECLRAITARDFQFGIFCGESGSGKTSFLQAGFLPALQDAPHAHQGIYVKFSDLDPLVSIRQAVCEQLSLSSESLAQANLLTLFDHAEQAHATPLVLLLDQFEQFFVHHRYKKDRAPFIRMLKTWYQQQPRSRVKILVSVRGDFADRLIEMQKVMGYALGPQEVFRLEKFTPQEATEVFGVIAEKEGLKFDKAFIEEVAAQELAGAEDRLVSPVDVQILAWMIAGQRTSAERAFDRTAYQKLGGVEGLLERYLSRALDARSTDAKRQAALKVLLALTDLDGNTRAGVLTEGGLKDKLAGKVGASEVAEAVQWLARGDVRLVTPSRRNGAQGYELAHERLIPALRRLAGKELTEAEQAGLLLDQRVNEWLGSERAARYLLSWREWRLIESQRPYIAWEPQKSRKEALVKKSKQRWRYRAGAAVLPVLLALGVLAWWLSPWGQVWQVNRDLTRLIVNLQDGVALTSAARAFASVGKEAEALAMARAISDSSSQAVALHAIATVVAQAGDPAQAQALSAEALAMAHAISDMSPYLKAHALRSIAESAARAGDLVQAQAVAHAISEPSWKGLALHTIAELAVQAGDQAQALAVARTISDSSRKAVALGDVAALAARAGDPAQAQALFAEALAAARAISNTIPREEALRSIAESVAQVGDRTQALAVARTISSPSWKAMALGDVAEAAAKAGDPAQAQALFAEALAAARAISEPFWKAVALGDVAEAAAKAGDPAQAQALFAEALAAARAIPNTISKAMALGDVAESAAQAVDPSQALAMAREIPDPGPKASALRSIAEAAAKNGQWRLAREAASQNVTDAGRAEALAAILEVWAAR